MLKFPFIFFVSEGCEAPNVALVPPMEEDWFNPWLKKKRKKKGNIKLAGTLFSASSVVISFTCAVGPVHSIYYVAMRGSPVLCTTSLLSSQSKLVPIYTPGSRWASYSKVPCSRTQHAAHTGFKLMTLESRVRSPTAEICVPLHLIYIPSSLIYIPSSKRPHDKEGLRNSWQHPDKSFQNWREANNFHLPKL